MQKRPKYDKMAVVIVDAKQLGEVMRISYKKLWILLAEREMSKQEFREKLQIASGTMTKMNKGQEVSMSVILRICDFFDCNIGDICDAVRDGAVK